MALQLPLAFAIQMPFEQRFCSSGRPQSQKPCDKNLVTKILLLGGGHSHAIALDYLAHHPIPGVQLQIIHPGTHALYSGMIPGHLSRHYSRDACQIDVQQLARRSGAILTQTEAIALDLDQQQVICASGESIGFDLLSINTGSVPLLPPGVILGDRIFSMKPLAQFLDQWQRFESHIQSGGGFHSGQVSPSIAIVGAGLGGIEVALNLNERWTERTLEISLFCQGQTLAPRANRSLQSFLTETLARRNIHVTTHATVTNTTQQENHVKLTYRQPLTDEGAPQFMTQCFDAVIFVTQASAPKWVSQSGLATDDRGFIAVEPTLRSTSHAQVFASGDIASLQGFPVPKSGVFAVRQGKPLAQNLTQAALNLPLNDYSAQHPSSLNALSLLNLGNGRAVGSYSNFSMTAPALQPLLWLLKDYVDRRFIRRISSVLRENLIAG